MRFGKLMILLSLAVIAGMPLRAADDNSSWAWNSWRDGFESFEQAERLSIEDRNKEALAQFRKALVVFQNIHQKIPAWNPEIVDSRIKLCQRRIERLKEKVLEEENKARKSAADRSVGDNAASVPSSSGDTEALKKVLAEYREKLLKALGDLEEAKQAASRYRDSAETVKKLLADKSRLEGELNSMRQRVTAAAQQAPTPTDELMEARKQLLTVKLHSDELQRQVRDLTSRAEKLEAEKSKLQQSGSLAQYDRKQLEEKIAAQEDSIKRLQEKLSGQETTQRESDKVLALLHAEKNKLQSALDKKFKAYDELYLQLQELRRRNITPVQGKNELVQENERFRKTNDELKEKNESLTAMVEQLRRKLEDTDLQRKSLSDTLVSWEKKRVVMEGDLKSFSEKDREHTALAAQREKTIAELTRKLKKQDQDLRLLADKYNRDSAVRKENEQQAATNAALRKKHEQQLTALQQELDAAVKKASTLETSGSNVQQELAARSREVGELRRQVTELQQKLVAGEQKQTTLVQQSEAMAKEKERAEQQVELSRRKLESIRKELTAQQQQNESLRKSFTVLTQEREKQRLNGEAQTAKIAALNKALTESTETLTTAQAELKKQTAAQSDAIKAAVEKYRQSLQQESSRNSALSNELAELKKTVAVGNTDATKELTGLRQEMQVVQRKNEALNEELNATRTKLAQKELTIRKLAAVSTSVSAPAPVVESKATTTDVDTLRRELAVSKQQLALDNGKLIEIQKRMSELQNDLQISRRLVASLQRENQANEKQQEEVQSAAASDFKADNLKLKKQVAKLEDVNQQLGIQVKALERSLKDGQATVAVEALSEAKELKLNLAKLTEENKRLEREVNAAAYKDQLLEKMRHQIAEQKQRLRLQGPGGQEKLLQQHDADQREIAALKKRIADIDAMQAKLNAEKRIKMAGEKEKTIAFLMAAGKNAWNQKDGEAALWHYRKVLAIDEDNYAATVAAGETLLQMKKAAEAKNYLLRAVAAKPGDGEVALSLIEAELALRELDAAAKLLPKVTMMVTDSTRLKLAQGRLALGQGNKAEAEKYFRQIPDTDAPAAAAAALELARIAATDAKRVREAAELYRKARDGGVPADPALEKQFSGR